MSSTISTRNARLVGQPSGNRCAFPSCRKRLIVDGTTTSSAVLVGEFAHICGEKQGSARYDASMTARQRNAAENLILLCLEHHEVIDGQPSDYSVAVLVEMKRDHEAWVDAELTRASTSVTFVELETVTKALVGEARAVTTDLTLTPPQAKINKNALSPRVQRLITIGLVNAQEVSRFLTGMDQLDSSFSERLLSRFSVEYARLRETNLSGDALFYALQDFASSPNADFERNAAGLAVLTHLFESCEIFEK